jgi:hypothetical protein
MARRISTNYLDRIYSALPYLLPMTAVVSIMVYGQILLLFGFANFIVEQFNPLAYALLPFVYINKLLSIKIIDFISIRFVAWFCVFVFLVRSYKVNHFIRFNAIQALLLDIIVALAEVITELLSLILGKLPFFPFVLQLIASVTFLGITAAFLYTVFECIRGKYADKIPVISEVAYYQIR